ncbi:MAG: hypothetical protein V1793_21400 [Pseudomonadota bacterium]
MKKLSIAFLAFMASVLFCTTSHALQVYLPHLTGTTTEWVDYLQADNQGSESAGFTLTLYNTAGAQIFSQNYSVPAKSKLLVDIKVQASSAGTTGIITYTDPGLGFRLSYEYQSGGLAEFFLSSQLRSALALYFSDFSSVLLYKGGVIANLSNASTSVTLYAVGNGQIQGQYSTTIGPRGKISGNPGAWFPSVSADLIEKIIAIAGTDCLDGLAIGSDATLEHMVFVPGQDGSPFALSLLTPLFSDTFDSNTNSWPINNSAESQSSIQSGWYTMTHVGDGGWYFPNSVPGFNQNKNYAIEASLKRVSGSTVDEFGLSFGYLDVDNKFDFSIFSDGWFGVYKKEGGSWTTLAELFSSAVQQADNSTNILKVIKIGSTMNFFINGVQVHTMPAPVLLDDRVGFHIWGDQSIAADYIKVTQAP